MAFVRLTHFDKGVMTAIKMQRNVPQVVKRGSSFSGVTGLCWQVC